MANFNSKIINLAIFRPDGRSCASDVDEKVVVELDDSPGTTNGTKFSIHQKV